MIDTHCHFDFDKFDGEREELIAEAKKAGVHTIINIGVDIESSKRSIDLAEKYDCIFATVGIHPHDATKINDDSLAELREMAAHPKVKAIGEIGLDFYRDRSPRPVQEKAFRLQLELAAELKLPVVIHTREAFEQTICIVKEYASDLPGGVFHCFPGSPADAARVIDFGFVVSVGGVVTFGNNKMAEIAASVDLDKLIIETDAPYLTPVPFRGKRNQPAYVKHVCDKVAELRGVNSAEVESQTDHTAQKLFRLVETFEG